ncbi:MAG: hypothetical protein ABI741_07290 [Ferruginibacter sp.]
MIHIIHSLSARSFLIIFMYAAGGCNSKGDKIIPAYNNYKFDLKVIEKLPIYDSLASAILEKAPLFQKNMNKNDSYQAFRYIPASNQTGVFRKLPEEAGGDIGRYFAKLGKDFIYGFDIFKDSTIKIYVRSKTIETTKVEITENLSYYPVGSNIKHREYPVKDSILNIRWQYWTRFDAPGLF